MHYLAAVGLFRAPLALELRSFSRALRSTRELATDTRCATSESAYSPNRLGLRGLAVWLVSYVR